MKVEIRLQQEKLLSLEEGDEDILVEFDSFNLIMNKNIARQLYEVMDILFEQSRNQEQVYPFDIVDEYLYRGFDKYDGYLVSIIPNRERGNMFYARIIEPVEKVGVEAYFSREYFRKV